MPPLPLPERTLETWAAIEIATRFPTSLIWAPSQRQQRRAEPYDFLIRSKARHVFGLEVKAFTLTNCVTLVASQHEMLMTLPMPLRGAIFYCLPNPQPALGKLISAGMAPGLGIVPSVAALRLSPSARDWLRILPITTVDKLAASLPWAKATRQLAATRYSAEGWSLDAFLTLVDACTATPGAAAVDAGLRDRQMLPSVIGNLLWVAVP